MTAATHKNGQAIKDDVLMGIANNIRNGLDRVFYYRDAGACTIECAGMCVTFARPEITRTIGNDTQPIASNVKDTTVKFDGEFIAIGLIDADGTIEQTLLINARGIISTRTTRGATQ